MGGARQRDLQWGAESVRPQRVVSSHVYALFFFFKFRFSSVVNTSGERCIRYTVVRLALSQL